MALTENKRLIVSTLVATVFLFKFVSLSFEAANSAISSLKKPDYWSYIHAPKSGELEALPKQARSAIALLRANNVPNFKVDSSFVELESDPALQNYLYQRLVEGAWPSAISNKSRFSVTAFNWEGSKECEQYVTLFALNEVKIVDCAP